MYLVSFMKPNSKIDDLQKISGLLNEHKNDIAAFMTEDPRGMALDFQLCFQTFARRTIFQINIMGV